MANNETTLLADDFKRPIMREDDPVISDSNEEEYLKGMMHKSLTANDHEPKRYRCGGIIQQTARIIKNQDHLVHKETGLVLSCSIHEYNESPHVKPTELLAETDNAIAFISRVSDIMHLRQTLDQPNKVQFFKEIMTHKMQKHWKLLAYNPKGAQIPDFICSIRRKGA